MHYTGMSDGKRQKKFQHCGFLFAQDTSTLCVSIQNLKTLALLGAEISVTENCIGEKERKRQINGMISMMMLILS